MMQGSGQPPNDYRVIDIIKNRSNNSVNIQDTCKRFDIYWQKAIYPNRSLGFSRQSPRTKQVTKQTLGPHLEKGWVVERLALRPPHTPSAIIVKKNRG
jgi:hypothetical protein